MTRAPTMRGGVLVLIILIMISLSVFSVLAWASANGDLKMAEKNAEWIKQYYELDALGTSELIRARDAFAHLGSLEALSDLGWDVSGDFASIDVTTGARDDPRAQHLYIEVEDDGAGGIRVVKWLQWQDPLPADSEWNDIIIFD